jgi:hypothetical protein
MAQIVPAEVLDPHLRKPFPERPGIRLGDWFTKIGKDISRVLSRFLPRHHYCLVVNANVATLENQLTERFGLLMSYTQLAEWLGRSAGGLRYSLSYPSDVSTRALKACGRKIGRRMGRFTRRACVSVGV